MRMPNILLNQKSLNVRISEQVDEVLCKVAVECKDVCQMAVVERVTEVVTTTKPKIYIDVFLPRK